jgi:hypothetical protein
MYNSKVYKQNRDINKEFTFKTKFAYTWGSPGDVDQDYSSGVQRSVVWYKGTNVWKGSTVSTFIVLPHQTTRRHVV